MPLPRIRAAELMTENLRTVRVDDPIGEAADVLQTTDFRHLLLVDEQGELVGMLSDRDLRALQLPCSADTAVVRRALGRRRRRRAARHRQLCGQLSQDPRGGVTRRPLRAQDVHRVRSFLIDH